MNKKLTALGLLLIAVTISTSGCGCKGGTTAAVAGMKPIVLDYWRVWDGPDSFRGVIAEYRKIHPNVTINYRKLSMEEYEQELLNAMAEDRGPCMFSINSAWIKKYQSKISSMPDQITMAYPTEQGTLKKEIIPVLKTRPGVSVNNVKSSFIDTVYKDVVLNYYNPKTKKDELRVFGLPLAIDTMVMFYNRDLLNNEGIADLAHGDENGQVYWNKQFQEDVRKLTKADSTGTIKQAGAALGSGNNISNASDILTLIMMQSGARIIDNNLLRPVFADNVPGLDYNPGILASDFYTSFSNPKNNNYSWNKNLDNDQKMFLEGRLAIMFSYSYLLPIIKTQAPKLNFGIMPMPQIPGNAVKNAADYWVETVSKKCKNRADNTDAAYAGWDFIQFITYNNKINKLYLDAAKKMPALRSLVEISQTDSDLGIFAKELLTSQTWYTGYDYQSADQAMKDMVETINGDPKNLEHEVKLTQDKIRRTLEDPKN